jgi:hypothetical protein
MILALMKLNLSSDNHLLPIHKQPVLSPPLPRNEEPPTLKLNHIRLAHIALLHDALRWPIFIVDDGPNEYFLIRRPELGWCACACVEHCTNGLGGIAMAPGSRQEHVRNFEGEGRACGCVAVAWRECGFAGSEGAESDQADELGVLFLRTVLLSFGGLQEFVNGVGDAIDFVFSLNVRDGEDVLQGSFGVFECSRRAVETVGH